MTYRLILASGSAIRATILTNAGIPFEIVKSNVDEDAIKAKALAKNQPLTDIAMELAIAKAKAVPADGKTLVLGADQILQFDTGLFDKPHSRTKARERLNLFSGKPHQLINASALLLNGEVIYKNLDIPKLHMRALTDRDLDAYFSAVDDSVLASVGAYQVEGPGIRLFDRIDGDYFAVLGLALSPLLPVLRQYSVIDF